MSVALNIDFSQFDKAMVYYQQATRKDIPYVLNRSAGNLAAKASQFAITGNRADIQGLKEKEWWPKYISKVLKVRGFALHRRVKARGAQAEAVWRDPVTGKLKKGRKTRGVVSMLGMGGSSVNKAFRRRVSAKIIRRRIATLNSFKAIFALVAQKFGRPVSRVGHKMTPGAARVVPANPARWLSEFSFSFTNNRLPWPTSPGSAGKPSPEQDVGTKKLIAEAAIQAALPVVVADMTNYATEQLAKRAREISARAA